MYLCIYLSITAGCVWDKWCPPSTTVGMQILQKKSFLFVCFCQFVTSMQRRGDGISFCFSCVVSTSRIPKGLFSLMAKASLCSR